MAGTTAIIHYFIRDYLKEFVWIFAAIEIFGIILFAVSEVVKLIVKARVNKKHSMWNRINLYHKIFLFFFLFCLLITFFNEVFLKTMIPKEILGYLVFLSLGNYIGFHLCLSEFKRIKKLNAKGCP